MSDAARTRHPAERILPGREIRGMSAVLLPFESSGGVDWDGCRRLLERTVACGLTPAVNMDTGYAQLIDQATRLRVLELAGSVTGGEFVGGAFVSDGEGDVWAPDRYRRALEEIEARGGLPIVFPSHGLNALPASEWVEAHAELARTSDRFLGFELGPMFVPYGRIYDLDAYRGLMAIPQCVGAKHSSLDRGLEWQRLAARDAARPDFLVLTGNDLAIDMVMYGSDYLLGLSCFAPEHFAMRDRLWTQQSEDFYALNDLLQYLGFFAFRDPVPGYKHDAAIFLEHRGRIGTSKTHPGSPQRPDSDRAVLADIWSRLEAWSCSAA